MRVYSSSGKLYLASQLQWAPGLLSHDPNPPIILEDPIARGSIRSIGKSYEILAITGRGAVSNVLFGYSSLTGNLTPQATNSPITFLDYGNAQILSALIGRAELTQKSFGVSLELMQLTGKAAIGSQEFGYAYQNINLSGKANFNFISHGSSFSIQTLYGRGAVAIVESSSGYELIVPTGRIEAFLTAIGSSFMLSDLQLKSALNFTELSQGYVTLNLTGRGELSIVDFNISTVLINVSITTHVFAVFHGSSSAEMLATGIRYTTLNWRNKVKAKRIQIEHTVHVSNPDIKFDIHCGASINLSTAIRKMIMCIKPDGTIEHWEGPFVVKGNNLIFSPGAWHFDQIGIYILQTHFILPQNEIGIGAPIYVEVV